MEWKDLVEFTQHGGGSTLDKAIVERMLDDEISLPTKNIFTPEERNMLLLLEMADRELGCDTKQFRLDFMLHQLSLNGFNRASLDRMVNPNIIPPQAAPTKAP